VVEVLTIGVIQVHFLFLFLRQLRQLHLADEFHHSSGDEARQCLRSASTSSLIVLCTRLATIGDRAFPVAAARLWNTLPLNVTSESSILFLHTDVGVLRALPVGHW